MSTLWLHIGQPKTGSSALQVFFARNAEAFWRQGSAYPWGDAARDGSTTSGNGQWLAWYQEGFPGQFAETRAMLATLAAGRGLVLSSEYFSGASRRLLRALKQRVGDVRVLVYLRSPADMIVAHYAHELARTPHRPETSLAEYAADYWCRPYARQAAYLDGLAALFGRENIAARSYRLARADLARDAVTAMGFAPDGFDYDVPRVNATPPPPDEAGVVMERLKEISRPEIERVATEWFPGQTVEDVYG